MTKGGWHYQLLVKKYIDILVLKYISTIEQALGSWPFYETHSCHVEDDNGKDDARPACSGHLNPIPSTLTSSECRRTC